MTGSVGVPVFGVPVFPLGVLGVLGVPAFPVVTVFDRDSVDVPIFSIFPNSMGVPNWPGSTGPAFGCEQKQAVTAASRIARGMLLNGLAVLPIDFRGCPQLTGRHRRLVGR
jgi:hypothetical protein